MTTLQQGSRGAEVKTLQAFLNLYPDGIYGTATAEAVRQFQREYGLTPDGICGPKTLACIKNHAISAVDLKTPYTAGGLTLRRSTRHVREIIIHCSATPEGRDFTVSDITRWHRQQGWSTIGYHYVIYRDGTIHEGRDINLSGAHCTGHNTGSIGICYIGGIDIDGKTPKDTRTERQRMALYTLLQQLRHLYPDATIHGHREFAKKACPSFDVKAEYGKM